MANVARVQRVSESIQQNLAKLLLREVNDPRLQLLNITGVEVSRDLAHARVYFALPGDQKAIDEALKALEKASGFLRKRLGDEIDLRLTPSLKFFYDPAVRAGSRIDALLKDLNE